MRVSWSNASAGSWRRRGAACRETVRQGTAQDESTGGQNCTERVDGELRFRSVPPLLVPLRELFDPVDARDEKTEYVRELLDEYAASLDEDRRYLFGTKPPSKRWVR